MNLAALWLAVTLVGGALPAGETPLPPPQPAPTPERHCERFNGTVAGNDPSVTTFLTVCGEDDVTGIFFWNSKKSGSSVRAVSGTRTKDGSYTLKDDRLLEDHPNPGWRFCLVDRYELGRVGDRLEGRYVSRACNDAATVSLVLVKR